MEPLSANSPIQKVADPCEQSTTNAQQVFKIGDLFATISLMSDPKTSLSLLCCSQKIYQFYTCRKENSKFEKGEKEIFIPDASAFEEVTNIFNYCLGIEIPKGGSPSAKLQRYQRHFNSILEAVKSRMVNRKMAMDEEVDRLCWSDLPLLKKWIAASDKLTVWQMLANASNVEGPLRANLTALNSCMEEADKFSEWFDKNIVKLESLQGLDSRYSQLASLPAEIGRLVGLQKLNLSGNKLTALPTEIGQLTRLQELNLLENHLVALPAEIGQLKGLKMLCLNHNLLRALPVEIGQLAGLERLDFSYNRLTQLPSEIGQLVGLKQLSFSHNSITKLPSEIGQLTQLNELDSSHNKLTALPAEIGQLAQLNELYVFNNELTALPAEIGELEKRGCINY